MPEPFTTRALSVGELRLEADRGTLYAVLDACGEPRVVDKVRELGPELAVSLYRGRAEEDLYAIAPYLVRVGPELLTWLTETLWADPWGIFIEYDAGLEPLRTHLRKFLLVDGPDGEEWYFRFYDPRVLAAFLSTCDDAQRDELFGPVAAYGWTDPDTYGAVLASPPALEPRHAPPRITVRTRMKIPQAQADALGGCQDCQPGKVPDAPKRGGDAPLPSVLVADPAKPDWIGLKLTERDGSPVPGEPFVVTPSDGSPIRGKLDKQGRIRIEGVPPGSYTVTFPERDAKEWKKG